MTSQMSKKSTIRGVAIDEVWKKLREPLPESYFKITKNTHYHYLPYEKCLEVFDSIVGKEHYEFVPVAPAEIRQIKNQSIVIITGTLSIMDDDGEVVLRLPGCGGETISISGTTGNATGLNNDIKQAVTRAVVSSLQFFGIGRAQLQEKRKGKRHSAQSESSGNAETPALEKFQIQYTQKMISMNRGYRSVGNVLRTVDNTISKNMEIIIFQEGVLNIEKKLPMSEYVQNVVPGAKCNVLGYLNEFRGKWQLIVVKI